MGARTGGARAPEAQEVMNRHLAKAGSDAGWARFRHWIEYYGRLHQVPVIAGPPHYTSQLCSGCGVLVRTSLSI
jgi:putative transposase